MSEYRTHTCNELRESDTGKEVRLSGFVKTIRDLGGCVFIDLRDHYGITQLTTEDPKLLEQIKEINVEAAITVDGTVVKRPEENVNDKISTGKVEVEIKNSMNFSKNDLFLIKVHEKLDFIGFRLYII